MRYFVTLVSLVGPLVITLILQRSRKAGGESNYKRIKDASGYFIVFADQRRKKLTIINYYHSKIKRIIKNNKKPTNKIYKEQTN